MKIKCMQRMEKYRVLAELDLWFSLVLYFEGCCLDLILIEHLQDLDTSLHHDFGGGQFEFSASALQTKDHLESYSVFTWTHLTCFGHTWNSRNTSFRKRKCMRCTKFLQKFYMLCIITRYFVMWGFILGKRVGDLFLIFWPLNILWVFFE